MSKKGKGCAEEGPIDDRARLEGNRGTMPEDSIRGSLSEKAGGLKAVRRSNVSDEPQVASHRSRFETNVMIQADSDVRAQQRGRVAPKKSFHVQKKHRSVPYRTKQATKDVRIIIGRAHSRKNCPPPDQSIAINHESRVLGASVAGRRSAVVETCSVMKNTVET